MHSHGSKALSLSCLLPTLRHSLRLNKLMSKLKKAIKVGVIAGACTFGLSMLARRLKLANRIARLAQSIEAVPFPGTRLYAFLAAKQLRPLYREIAREICDEQRFKHVLDLNTGPGYLPIELALASDSIEVIGIDPSPDMVRVAKANAKAENVGKRIRFAIGEPSDLPFPGRHFDLVVSVNMLHHWRDPVQVFEETYRVLRPGGEFWLYDYRKDVPMEEWLRIENELPFHLRGLFELGPIASWKAAYDESKVRELAQRTHFSDPILENRVLPLFGKPMPVFVSIKLHKEG